MVPVGLQLHGSLEHFAQRAVNRISAWHRKCRFFAPSCVFVCPSSTAIEEKQQRPTLASLDHHDSVAKTVSKAQPALDLAHRREGGERSAQETKPGIWSDLCTQRS
jgi:hypothetical protein